MKLFLLAVAFTAATLAASYPVAAPVASVEMAEITLPAVEIRATPLPHCLLPEVTITASAIEPSYRALLPEVMVEAQREKP